MDEKLLEETISILQDAVISNQRHISSLQDSVIFSHEALRNVQEAVIELYGIVENLQCQSDPGAILKLSATVDMLARGMWVFFGVVAILVLAITILALKIRNLQIDVDNLAKKQKQQDFINSKTNQVYDKVILKPIKEKSKSKKEA